MTCDRCGDQVKIVDQTSLWHIGWCERCAYHVEENCKKVTAAFVQNTSEKLGYPHYFADHQHCLKCGRSEALPDVDNCTMSDEEWDARRRKEVGR